MVADYGVSRLAHLVRSWRGRVGRWAEAPSRPALVVARDLIIGLGAVFLIGVLISRTDGLPNPYVNLYYLVIVYVSFRTPMPWPLALAGLAALIPSPEGFLNIEEIGQDAETGLLRVAIFLVVAALVNNLSNRFRRQGLALRESLQTQQELTQRLLTAQEDERRQLAYDIHDGLGQMIVAAGMHTDIYRCERKEEEFTRAVHYLQEAIVETRRIVSELRPALLDDLGLVQALRNYLEEMAGRVGWQAKLVENLGYTRLDPVVETALFRIAQEALANAHKHAQAQRVEIRLLRAGSQLLLEVQDWGVGFDVNKALANAGEGRHIGLASMQERAQLLGAQLRWISAPGQGTTIKVSLALVEEPEACGKEAAQLKEGEEEETAAPPPDGEIAVLICDDHPMVREGLRSMLNVSGIRVVGEVGTGREAVEQVRRLRPDVVLMDVRMPDMDGLAATEVVKGELPTISIIILTSYESKDYLRRAIEAGAAGYVLKGMPRDTLVDAIKVAKGGGSLIDAKLLSQLLQELGVEGTRFQETAGLLEALTPRERQVLELLVQGLTNKEIAAQMHYSVGTVKNVVQRLIEKLGVSDRTQAAVLAVRAGLASSQFPDS